jgi:hypothetical protein
MQMCIPARIAMAVLVEEFGLRDEEHCLLGASKGQSTLLMNEIGGAVQKIIPSHKIKSVRNNITKCVWASLKLVHVQTLLDGKPSS